MCRCSLASDSWVNFGGFELGRSVQRSLDGHAFFGGHTWGEDAWAKMRFLVTLASQSGAGKAADSARQGLASLAAAGRCVLTRNPADGSGSRLCLSTDELASPNRATLRFRILCTTRLTLCPGDGDGAAESHCVWEALAAGSVPVIRLSPAWEVLGDHPLPTVANWTAQELGRLLSRPDSELIQTHVAVQHWADCLRRSIEALVHVRLVPRPPGIPMWATNRIGGASSEQSSCARCDCGSKNEDYPRMQRAPPQSEWFVATEVERTDPLSRGHATSCERSGSQPCCDGCITDGARCRAAVVKVSLSASWLDSPPAVPHTCRIESPGPVPQAAGGASGVSSPLGGTPKRPPKETSQQAHTALGTTLSGATSCNGPRPPMRDQVARFLATQQRGWPGCAGRLGLFVTHHETNHERVYKFGVHQTMDPCLVFMTLTEMERLVDGGLMGAYRVVTVTCGVRLSGEAPAPSSTHHTCSPPAHMHARPQPPGGETPADETQAAPANEPDPLSAGSHPWHGYQRRRRNAVCGSRKAHSSRGTPCSRGASAHGRGILSPPPRVRRAGPSRCCELWL